VAKVAVWYGRRGAILSSDVTVFVKETARYTEQRSGFIGGQHLGDRAGGQFRAL